MLFVYPLIVALVGFSSRFISTIKTVMLRRFSLSSALTSSSASFKASTFSLILPSRCRSLTSLSCNSAWHRCILELWVQCLLENAEWGKRWSPVFCFFEANSKGLYSQHLCLRLLTFFFLLPKHHCNWASDLSGILKIQHQPTNWHQNLYTHQIFKSKRC